MTPPMPPSMPPRPGADPAELFQQLASRLLVQPGVHEGTGFGAVPGLRIDQKIFAMLCRGELVVKLPRHRVDQLVADGSAARFDARRDGRLMKEWAAVRPDQGHAWEALAVEALRFVSPER